MIQKLIVKTIVLLFASLVLIGCNSSLKRSVIDLTLPYGEGDLNCEQALENIKYILDESSQIPNFGSASLVTGLGLALGTIAVPIIIAGELAHSSKSKKDAIVLEEYLDGLISSFDQRDCMTPPDWNRNTESVRRAELLADNGQKLDKYFFTPKLETLAFPNRCANAADDLRRVYEIGIKDLKPSEYLRFTTVGKKTINHKVKASHLLFGDVKLPSMSISSRKGGWKRGLWVERLETGDKFQLNYLRPNPSCNSKSTMTVEYRNLWAVVSVVK